MSGMAMQNSFVVVRPQELEEEIVRLQQQIQQLKSPRRRPTRRPRARTLSSDLATGGATVAEVAAAAHGRGQVLLAKTGMFVKSVVNDMQWRMLPVAGAAAPQALQTETDEGFVDITTI